MAKATRRTPATKMITVRMDKEQLAAVEKFAKRIIVPVENVVAVILGFGINKELDLRHSLHMASLLSQCQDAFHEKWHPKKIAALNAAIGAQLKEYAKTVRER